MYVKDCICGNIKRLETRSERDLVCILNGRVLLGWYRSSKTDGSNVSLVVKMELGLCIMHTFALFLCQCEVENYLRFSRCRKVSQPQVNRSRQCTIRLTFTFLSFPEAKYENFPDILHLTFSVQVSICDCDSCTYLYVFKLTSYVQSLKVR